MRSRFEIFTEQHGAVLIFDIPFGMVVVLMAESGLGGVWEMADEVKRSGVLLATMGFGVLIFVDDYFNRLTVGSVMRGHDSHKVSRETRISSTPPQRRSALSRRSQAGRQPSTVCAGGCGNPAIQLFLRTIPYNLYDQHNCDGLLHLLHRL